MKNITITRTKNIANATYLPYKAYTRALALATELGGVIGKTAEGNFKATFSSAKIAEKFVKAWTAEYEANRKVEVAPTPKSTPKAQKSTTSEPTATKTETKPTASTRKPKADAPKKAKGKTTLNDFIKANPLCTREEAKAHGFKGTRAELKALKAELGVR